MYVVGIIVLLFIVYNFWEHLFFYIIGGIFGLIGLFCFVSAKSVNDDKKLSDEQWNERYPTIDKKTNLPFKFIVIGIVSICICGLSLKYQTESWNSNNTTLIAQKKAERQKQPEQKNQQEQEKEKEQKKSEDKQDYFCIVDGVGKVKGVGQNGVGVAVYRISGQKSIKGFPETFETNGKFVLLDAVVCNELNAQLNISSNKFTLIDENGRRYSTDLRKEEKANNLKNRFDIYKEINPGLVDNSRMLFEVPRDCDLSKSKLEYSIGGTINSKSQIKSEGTVTVPVRVEIVQ